MIRLGRAARMGAVVVTLSLVAGPLTAARAGAPMCAYDTLGRLLTVTATSSQVYLETGAGWLVVNDVNCALLAEVNDVDVNMGGFANTVLVFDVANGPFGPGFTNEGNGSSEIEFDVTGFGPGSSMGVYGSSGADGFALGHRLLNFVLIDELNLNSIADGATKDADVRIHGSPPGGIRLVGGDGDDILTGAGVGTIGARAYSTRIVFDDGSGSDWVTGGNGDDLLLIDVGARDNGDDYSGGPGKDTASLDSSVGGTPSPYISLNDSSDDGLGCPFTLQCEADNYASDIERIEGSLLPERIVGGPGSQELIGLAGNDEISGGGGADYIDGGIGADTLRGGPGPDVLIGGHGPDIINGGGGIDTVDYSSATDSVSVNLNGVADDGTTAEGDNIAGNVENAIGSSYDDVFYGTKADNDFRGRDGNDLFYGKRGDDELIGGLGDDHFWGGPGSDRCAQGIGTGTKQGCER